MTSLSLDELSSKEVVDTRLYNSESFQVFTVKEAEAQSQPLDQAQLKLDMQAQADNVGSKQMQQIHMSLRGKAVVLTGKNTMMRKAIRGHLENNLALEKLLPHIRGNVGFVFTREDLTEIRDMLLANKALGITTKISRGTIEILSDVQLIKTGDKVGASEATLLTMLNISPFSFGLIIQQVFDNGSIHNPEVLDITEQTLHSRFLEGVRNVASVCADWSELNVCGRIRWRASGRGDSSCQDEVLRAS
ncbi:hypothetical protein STEG23_017231, partial [Scotinomys teguina]